MKKILFTGGGSAGHVLPAIALIEEILSDGIADVCYMGTNGIEKSILSEWKIPFYEISCPKLVRGGGFSAFKENLKIPFRLKKAVAEAKKGLEIFKPDVVFSKGGFVALPVVLASKKLKIPCFAHESDLSPGLTTRLTATKCIKTFTSFPETAKKIKRGVYSGAPIRRVVFNSSKADARRKLGIGFHEKVLLVFGGGSGSKAINDALRKALPTLTEKYFVLHVCGKGNLVKSNVKNYMQFEFVSDMGTLYACSDAVVARAGAGTIFELLSLKKPSLLIPLSGATRGDQIENAHYFQSRGLCRVLSQDNLFSFFEEVTKLFTDEQLKSRLLDCEITCGNKKIIESLRAQL